ncbi:MAG: J domain-containing protein, partial [Deltaproteobacteria bacterium]|nr:J domain-containing protein [Candidatus Anaeroferrophillacea bacterium]
MTVDEMLWARDLMGLGERASPAQLRARYRELARRCHPDVATVAGSAGPRPSMAELNAAYRLLSSYMEQLEVSLTPADFRRHDPAL